MKEMKNFLKEKYGSYIYRLKIRVNKHEPRIQVNDPCETCVSLIAFAFIDRQDIWMSIIGTTEYNSSEQR